MSTFKKKSVVMLSTNKKAGTIWKTTNGQLIHTNVSGEYKEKYQPYHIYIISNEKIKEGDWCYHLDAKELIKFDSNNGDLKYLCKKIISTTNSSLKLPYDGTTSIDKDWNGKSLPQPSKAFIEKYVEEYNKGNKIIEVMVEYENIVANNPNIEYDYQGIKINPKDNTITIKKVKNS